MYIVYQTENLVNGKIYIGVHKCKDETDQYLGSGKLIKRAVKKYGEENFKRTTLFKYDCENDYLNKKNAFIKERELVSKEFTHRKDTYNLSEGGHENPVLYGKNNPFFGKHHSEETRQKLSQNMKGREVSEETRKRMSEAKMGKKIFRSKEHNEKISKALTGIDHHWQNKINKNPEKIRKTAEAHRGMKRSEDAKRKMSQAKKGKPAKNKGKIYMWCETTHETKMINKNENIPDGWHKGFLPKEFRK